MDTSPLIVVFVFTEPVYVDSSYLSPELDQYVLLGPSKTLDGLYVIPSSVRILLAEISYLPLSTDRLPEKSEYMSISLFVNDGVGPNA